ncbi:MAG: hypothetical protein P0S93_05515 [Candidatus Neptunochlamydia sp.]|nr:hypothetical protein [Candidatus Neptunochlamydia sp.]
MEKITRKTHRGVPHVAATIEEDLDQREMGPFKPHVKGLADIAADVSDHSPCFMENYTIYQK